MTYLGFDPGKDKCGIAIVNIDGQPLHHEVVAAAAVLERIPQLCVEWAVTQVVIGDRTMTRQWQAQLAPMGLPIAPIDEHNSSLEARELYWEMYPPQGFQRLIPQGMRLPPRPIDDLVAIILVRRYLAGQRSS
jgi:RNase H-fold protein (predicted Holliday junction resolvase)